MEAVGIWVRSHREGCTLLLHKCICPVLLECELLRPCNMGSAQGFPY